MDLAGPPPDEDPPARVESVVVPRWVQLVALPLISARRLRPDARAAGAVVLLFIIASLVVLLLNPFVTLLRRLRIPAWIRGALLSS